MRTLFYNTKSYERNFLEHAKAEHTVLYTSEGLTTQTVGLAKGFESISIFATDTADAPVLRALKMIGVRYITIRSPNYENVDIAEANSQGIHVANVQEYSPHAVAEHALCLLLALSRKTIQAHEQVQQLDFTLDHLIGFDLMGKKVGLLGTGKIGSAMAKILHGLGCTILAYDVDRNQQLENNYNVYYVGLHTLCSMSDIISIHLPPNNESYPLVTSSFFSKMKRGVIIINTACGAVLDTMALIEYLESGHIGAAGLDVYENEKEIFYQDLSQSMLKDPILLKLMSFPNVIITPHQGFATKEALTKMAMTTFENISCWEQKNSCANQITYGLQNELATKYQSNNIES